MKKAGIYVIENRINKKVYIGSSCNVVRRKSKHFWQLRLNNHNNIYLQRSFNKYGENNFEFYKIESININIVNETELGVFLTDREQYWIDSFNACDEKFGYNIRPRADRKKIAERTKIILSQKSKDQWKKGNVNISRCFKKGNIPHNKGKRGEWNQTELGKERIGKAIKQQWKDGARKGKKKTDIAKINSAIGHYKKVYQYDLNGKLIREFESIINAGSVIGIDSTSISKAVNGKLKTAKNYRWSFFKYDHLDFPSTRYRRPIIQLDLNDKILNYFDSCWIASKILNISTGTLYAGLIRGSIVHKKYKFKDAL